jgi:hypothetical protein
MNNPVISRVYVQNDTGIASHLGQWFGGLLLFVGLLAV